MAKVNPQAAPLLNEACKQRTTINEQLDRRLEEHKYLQKILLNNSIHENDNKVNAAIQDAQIKMDATCDNSNQIFCELHNLHLDICDKFEQYTNLMEFISNGLNYANQVTNADCAVGPSILVDLNSLQEHWNKFLQDSKTYLEITQEHRKEVEVFARNEKQNQLNQQNKQIQIRLELAKQVQELKLLNVQKVKTIEEYCKWEEMQIYSQYRNALNKIQVELTEKLKALSPPLNSSDTNEAITAMDPNPVPTIDADFEQNIVGKPVIFEILD